MDSISTFSTGEALRWLAKKYNIEIKERELTDEEKQVQNIRESLFVVNEFARDYFQNILYNHADGKAIAMSYFRQRGIRDDIVKKFQLGYSTTASDALAQEAMRKGYKKEFLDNIVTNAPLAEIRHGNGFSVSVVVEDVLKIIAGKLIDYKETFPYILYLFLLIGQFAFLYFYIVFFG